MSDIESSDGSWSPRGRAAFFSMMSNESVIDEIGPVLRDLGEERIAPTLAEISRQFAPRSTAGCLDARGDIVRASSVFAAMRREVVGDAPQLQAAHDHHARTAPLWWVPSEMVDLIDVASTTVPEDSTLMAEMLVELSGVAFFGAPIIRGLAGRPLWHFNAMQWGLAHIDGRDSVLFALLARSPRGWNIVGESWWPIGDDLGTPMPNRPVFDGESEGDAHATHLQDRSLAAALWLVSSQKGLTTSTFERVGRPELKRARRAGLPTAPVRVLNLRSSGGGESKGGSVDWSHRWIVRGHWRQQPYGPGGELRRPRWIAPYVKGPEDKPLDTRPSVRVLNEVTA